MTSFSCPLLIICFLPVLHTDPHIKVSGKREDVREAKETIMSVLDTKVSTKHMIFMVTAGTIWVHYIKKKNISQYSSRMLIYEHL